MLKGIDISYHQHGINLQAISTDFIIAKATQGTWYVNPDCDKTVQYCIKNGKAWGFYHFAEAQKDPVTEARYFYNNTKNYFGHGIPFLDWENFKKNGRQYTIVHKTEWALAFLNEIQRLSGVKPMIYMSESVENHNDWSKVVQGDYGLWIAKYRDNQIDYNYDMTNAGSKPKTKYWRSYAIWQWTSKGRLDGYNGDLDCDVFYGDLNAWNAYAGKHKQEPVSDGLMTCNQGTARMTVLGYDKRKNMIAFDADNVKALINCNYFTGGGTTLGVAQGDNVSKIPHQKQFIALAELKTGEVVVMPSDQYWFDTKDVKFGFSPYSVTRLNGSPCNLRSSGCSNKETGKRQTTAVYKTAEGWNFAVGQYETPTTITNKLIKRGASTIAILDGGGSTGMIVDHKWIFKTDRPITTCLAFKQDKTDPVDPVVPTEPNEDLKEQIKRLENENQALKEKIARTKEYVQKIEMELG